MRSAFARLVVRAAALLAPPLHRSRFVREWEAELWHAERKSTDGAGGDERLRAALGAFADARALREASHDDGESGTMGEWTSGWGKDLKAAARGLLRSPGYTAVAVLTLGIGIGGSAAIWTLVDRVVLDPLDYPEPERLLRVENQVPGVGPNERWELSTAQWVHITDQARTLEEVAIWRTDPGNLLTPSGPVLARAVSLTSALLPLLGAEASVGRLITEEDDQPGSAPVALLSHGFWTRALGADRGVVGSTLTFDDESVEVIGILASGVELPRQPPNAAPEIWLPMRVDRSGTFGNNHAFRGIARMAPGATPATVEAELERLTLRLPERFPRAYSQGFFDRYGFRTVVTPLKASVVGDLDTNLWILFGAVGLVLLIACANVANLFLVRAEGRRRELAIRSALGAGRASIARHLVAEGLVTSLTGGALALVVAFWAVPALTAMAPADLPRIRGVGIDGRTAAFALALSVLVGLALALYPILAHAGPGSARSLSDAGRPATTGRERQRLRSTLVVAQVALALTLMVGAGLLVQTLRALNRTELGFEPDGVITVGVSPSFARHGSDEALWRLYDQLLDRVRGLPGVTVAGMTRELPVEGDFGCIVQGFDDRAVYARLEASGLTTCAGQEPTTPGYFEAMRIPVLQGRGLTDTDNDGASRAAVAVVSRAFAERFWPGEDPLGKRVAPSGRTVGGFHTVVGVVGDVPKTADGGGHAPLSEPGLAIYYPIMAAPDPGGRWGWWPGDLTLVVKTELATPTSLFPAIRRIAAELDPEMPLSDMEEMEDVVARALSEKAFVSLLLGIAAAVALLLAAVGLYGVIAYIVSRRTREIGTRMAMGARPGQVQRMIVGRSLGLAAGGLLVGVALALATTRVMEGLLVGVEPTSPVAFGGAILVLAAVALLASWIPARRASRVDPSVALRTE